ncbi:MAG: MarR family transcriptional regulator, partial [Planctomycetes bacterium]|nr:MarR family transcriptional regulator [Planctomycetota bacterium]
MSVSVPHPSPVGAGQELVDASEAVTMGELASALYLDLSTVTRAIDQLV